MRRYRVYVIELKDSVATKRGVPARLTDEPFVYVGYTGKKRRERLREHRTGERYVADRRWVKHYGSARADLWADWPTYQTKTEAEAGEAAFAESLIARGYTVANKVGKPLGLPSQV